MTDHAADSRAVTALQSLSAPDHTTRFVNQVVEGAPPEVTIAFFSWRTALFGRYDVFHVHWPELLVRARRPAKARLQRLAVRALLARFRLQRIPLIRTVHNLHPHEPGSAAETRVLDAIDRQTAVFIRLNPTTESDPARTVTILHGHYRDRFGAFDLPPAEPGRILYFGLIRPYKGVEELLAVFLASARTDLELRVVGRPSGGLREIVEREQERSERVSSRLEFVSDADLVAEVGRAELVVLPYREMHNSGSILVALSLDRPVLVPRSASNEALAEEVGAGWVRMYDGPLTTELLESAVEAARLPRADRPRLDDRDWAHNGVLTYETYLRALQQVRPARAGSAS